MRIVVTGGAGFIGSNLVDALVADGHTAMVIDDLSTGIRANLDGALASGRCELAEVDLLDEAALPRLIEGADAVVHLAANADVRFGWNAPRRDLEQNVHATLNVLEAMRATEVCRILFSSTGSVYGEAVQIPTPEDAGFPVQTSLYGASKVSAEAYLAAYAEAGFVSATVFRFVSIMGARYSHGHVIDFVRQLVEHPDRLTVLGDGLQRKSYLDVTDCVAAVTSRLPGDPPFEVFNLGVDDYCTVRDSVGWICARMGLEPELEFTGGDRGWIGDNPFIFLDTARIRETGWTHRRSIREAVEGTVDWLLAHPDRLTIGDVRG
ncbi:MAG: NAD-dependent epimerase/dehydratase family protein [Acidimicrobiia bacterium]